MKHIFLIVLCFNTCYYYVHVDLIPSGCFCYYAAFFRSKLSQRCQSVYLFYTNVDKSGLVLDCTNQRMRVSMMNIKLKAFTVNKPLVEFKATFSDLTSVPTEISQFPSLSNINLQFNSIISISDLPLPLRQKSTLF